MNDTTNTIIEHHMLREHPLWVLAIAIAILVAFGYVTLIRKKKI